MQSPDLVPTPLPGVRRPPIPIAGTNKVTRFRSVTIVFLLARWTALAVWYRITRSDHDVPTAKALRATLERIGGLWIKAGQLLSLRRDLFPPAFCDELAELQHRAFGFDPAVARGIVEGELGRPLDEVFSEWEAHPFAAASLSQVHRGRLRFEGHEVAVKVQRPDMEWTLSRDLALIRIMVQFLRFVPGLGHVEWDGGIWELTQIFREELDYGYEVGNLKRMRRNLKRHKVYVPEVFPQYCTSRVLVMEFVRGATLSEYIAAEAADPVGVRDWLMANEIDPNKLGRRILISFFRQVFEDNLFHGDLHPGNILLMRANRFCLLDLGTVGSMDARFRELYMLSYRAVAEQDYLKAADVTLMMCDAVPAPAINSISAEIIRAFRAWEARSHLPNRPFADKSMISVTGEVAAALHRHRSAGSWQLMKVGRTWGTIECAVSALISDMNYPKLLRKYYKEAAARRAQSGLRGQFDSLRRLTGTLSEYGVMVGPLLRRQAMVAYSAGNKVIVMVAGILSFVRLAALTTGLVLLFRYTIRDAVHTVPVLKQMDSITTWDVEIDLLVLVLLGLLIRQSSNVVRQLRRPEDQRAAHGRGLL